MTGRRRPTRPDVVSSATNLRNAFGGALGGALASPSPLTGRMDKSTTGLAGSIAIGYQHDVFPVTAAGAKTCTLTFVPINESEHVYVLADGAVGNGIHQRQGLRWTRADNSKNVAVNASADLQPGDTVIVEYAYYMNQPAPCDQFTTFPADYTDTFTTVNGHPPRQPDEYDSEYAHTYQLDDQRVLVLWSETQDISDNYSQGTWHLFARVANAGDPVALGPEFEVFSLTDSDIYYPGPYDVASFFHVENNLYVFEWTILSSIYDDTLDGCFLLALNVSGDTVTYVDHVDLNRGDGSSCPSAYIGNNRIATVIPYGGASFTQACLVTHHVDETGFTQLGYLDFGLGGNGAQITGFDSEAVWGWGTRVWVQGVPQTPVGASTGWPFYNRSVIGFTLNSSGVPISRDASPTSIQVPGIGDGFWYFDTVYGPYQPAQRRIGMDVWGYGYISSTPGNSIRLIRFDAITLEMYETFPLLDEDGTEISYNEVNAWNSFLSVSPANVPAFTYEWDSANISPLPDYYPSASNWGSYAEWGVAYHVIYPGNDQRRYMYPLYSYLDGWEINDWYHSTLHPTADGGFATFNYSHSSPPWGRTGILYFTWSECSQPPPARATQLISIRPNAIAAALESDLPLNLVGGAGQNTLADSTYPATYVRTSYSLDPGAFEAAVATFPPTNVGDGWTLVACELSINARATSNPGILNGLSFDVSGDILGGNTYTPYYYYNLYVPDSAFQTRQFRWVNSGGDALPSDAAVENGEIQILFGTFITVGGTEIIVDVNTIILDLYYIETSP